MFSLKPGDVVTALGPFGDFHIKPTQREMVYIGGGAGMAPLRAHLSHLFESEGTHRRVSFWYGARSRQEIFYQDYFEQLARRHPNFRFCVALSVPAPRGRLGGADRLHPRGRASRVPARAPRPVCDRVLPLRPAAHDRGLHPDATRTRRPGGPDRLRRVLTAHDQRSRPGREAAGAQSFLMRPVRWNTFTFGQSSVRTEAIQHMLSSSDSPLARPFLASQAIRAFPWSSSKVTLSLS